MPKPRLKVGEQNSLLYFSRLWRTEIGRVRIRLCPPRTRTFTKPEMWRSPSEPQRPRGMPSQMSPVLAKRAANGDGRMRAFRPECAGFPERREAMRGCGSALVQLGGFEPPTSGSTIRRSNQLSYSCTGSCRTRRAGNYVPVPANASRSTGLDPHFAPLGHKHPAVAAAAEENPGNAVHGARRHRPRRETEKAKKPGSRSCRAPVFDIAAGSGFSLA